LAGGLSRYALGTTDIRSLDNLALSRREGSRLVAESTLHLAGDRGAAYTARKRRPFGLGTSALPVSGLVILPTQHSCFNNYRCGSNTYLSSSQRALHDAASAVHFATHDPDSPQFCEQEKLTELHFEMHSAEVRTWVSWTLSSDAAGQIDPIPHENMRRANKYLIPRSPEARAKNI
jgi:hypothetical protein